MENGKRGSNDQLSTRIGAEFLYNFNSYLTKNKFKKTQFIRDALTYWMSVNGKPELVQQKSLNTQKENNLLRELLIEKERTISEKERTIIILQEQIQRLDGTRPHNVVHVNGSKNTKVTATAGTDRNAEHQNSGN